MWLYQSRDSRCCGLCERWPALQPFCGTAPPPPHDSLPPTLQELHGSSDVDVCPTCDSEYLRDSEPQLRKRETQTGRACPVPECNGKLRSSILQNGEYLRSSVFMQSSDAASECDLLLVLGCDLRMMTCDVIDEVIEYKKPFVIISEQVWAGGPLVMVFLLVLVHRSRLCFG